MGLVPWKESGAKLLGKDAFSSSQDSSVEKRIHYTCSKWVNPQRCFKSCGIRRLTIKFTKEKAFLPPLRSIIICMKRKNKASRNRVITKKTTFCLDGTCCHLRMKDSKATLNYKLHTSDPFTTDTRASNASPHLEIKPNGLNILLQGVLELFLTFPPFHRNSELLVPKRRSGLGVLKILCTERPWIYS